MPIVRVVADLCASDSLPEPGSRAPRAPLTWSRLAICASSLLALAPSVQAQSLPPSVTACLSETDVLKRLACYDREVGRYAHAPAAPAAAAAGSAAAGTAAAGTAAVGAAAVTAGAAKSAAPATLPAAAAAPAAAPAAAQEASSVTARITKIDSYPDAMVLHLDNGQVWQQVLPATAGPNLNTGDSVTIEKTMGSFWLSGRDGIAIKVKQRRN